MSRRSQAIHPAAAAGKNSAQAVPRWPYPEQGQRPSGRRQCGQDLPTASRLPAIDAAPWTVPGARRDDVRHQSAEAVEHRDGRIVVARSQCPVQQNVSVQQRANGVHHRILLVIALHQHGVKRSDAAVRKTPGPFYQACQHVQHRRSVTFCSRRLAGRQSNFTLRHREPRDGIDNQQNVLAQSAEIFCDSRRRQGSANTQKRRLIGSRTTITERRRPSSPISR